MFFMQFYWCWKHHILITSSYLFIYFSLLPFSCLERNGFVLIFLDFSFPGKKMRESIFSFFNFISGFGICFFFPFLFHDNNYRGKKGLFWKFHGVCMASEAKFLFVQGFCRKISSLHD